VTKGAPSHGAENPSSSIAGPLFLWLLLQLLALILAVARVPLSAHFARPPEALAVDEMLAVQITLSGMLFPWLMRTPTRCFAVILTAGPMLQLAGALAAMPTSRVMMLWCYVACWCLALAAWRAMLGSGRDMIGVAIANLLTIGGIALWYLTAEFSATARSFGVLAFALRAAHSSEFAVSGWMWSAVPALIALALLGGRKVAFRRSSSHP